MVMTVGMTDAARAQGGNSPASSRMAARRPEMIVLNALRANPLLAPYFIRVSESGGSIILSGRVGTKQVHDMAVRTVIDLGYPLRDDLVIDTAEAQRVAMVQTAMLGAGATARAGGASTMAGSAPYLAYPPPLFGRLDDPFFGLEPPLVSFPPWWGARQLELLQGGPNGPLTSGAVSGVSSAPTGAIPSRSMATPAAPEGGASGSPARGPAPIRGRLQLTVDLAGQVFLSGEVASEEDQKLIEEEARNTPGVTRVYSELKVASRPPETPPPPPQPLKPSEPEAKPSGPEVKPAQPSPAPPAPAQPATGSDQPNDSRIDTISRATTTPHLAIARDSQSLTRRAAESIARRPSLASLPVMVQSHNQTVTLSGKVPSAYEAMLAYRAVQQTPGVHDVEDRLEFQLPDENHPNPLLQRARPEDLEPYLTSQIQRHLGESAHVDRVRVRGDVVEIRGSLLSTQDQNRVLATLRSIPLLRDFHLDPTLTVD
jgi:osmotically-inducible protein OsmY